MGLQKISYTIEKNGKVHIEVENVTGSSCKDLTADVVQKLGAVEEVKEKPEFYTSNSNEEIQNVKNQ